MSISGSDRPGDGPVTIDLTGSDDEGRESHSHGQAVTDAGSGHGIAVHGYGYAATLERLREQHTLALQQS